MIKIENIEVTGWETAIRGMRNPMNSWEKSDSAYGCSDNDFCNHCSSSHHCTDRERTYIIGLNDLDLMKRLAKGGATHAKFRRMINVTMDITAPLYFWKEADTYKVGTVCNSCSTMHKIQAKEFTLDDFSCEHLFGDAKNEVRMFSLETGEHYDSELFYTPLDILRATIEMLNACRLDFLESHSKEDWWQMIQLLPSSYNQRRTVQLNYEVLSHIYFDRKDHKLDEWHTFCDMIRELPYAEDIIIVGSKSSENESMDILKKENEELKKRVEFLEGFIHSYTPGLNGF